MRIRSDGLTNLGGWLFARILQAIFRTLRLDIRTVVDNTSPYDLVGNERYIYSIWHDTMIVPAFGGPQPLMAALTSRHQDGSFVAAVLRAIGMTSVRGSTNHGGAAAVREILTSLREKHLVMTPDGPRGPRREMSRGIIFLASHSGRAIIPTVACCQRAWHIRGSWTDLVIPRPFSRVVMLAGEPFRVPPNLASDDLDEYRRQLQIAMDRLEVEAQRLLGLSRDQMTVPATL